MKIFSPGILSYFVSILAKSLIISFQYIIESIYFFYSNPLYTRNDNYDVTGFRKYLTFLAYFRDVSLRNTLQPFLAGFLVPCA
jgi:hypothetical protein